MAWIVKAFEGNEDVQNNFLLKFESELTNQVLEILEFENFEPF